MKFNWIVRFKNPNFWIGLVGVILCAMGVEASTFTSWQAVFDAVIAFIRNPFIIASTALAVWGYVQDHTTKGVGDTDLVMTYTKPRVESEAVDDEDDDEIADEEEEAE